jgi:ERCC4-type nuclease
MHTLTLDSNGAQILVDYREFRSTLPSFLHQKGFEVLRPLGQD